MSQTKISIFTEKIKCPFCLRYFDVMGMYQHLEYDHRESVIREYVYFLIDMKEQGKEVNLYYEQSN